VLTDSGGNKHLGIPIRFRDEPGRADLSLPDYGGHSAQLAREAGYDEATIASLIAKGAL
jgi:crotonobetainyl-CoA:carnitine CoA-transferase CaiB-like acyl-CoA transferase